MGQTREYVIVDNLSYLLGLFAGKVMPYLSDSSIPVLNLDFIVDYSTFGSWGTDNSGKTDSFLFCFSLSLLLIAS